MKFARERENRVSHHSRLRVVPLSLSPSCVTRKKTARKKWPRKILGGEEDFARPFFSRGFLSRHADRLSERGTTLSLYYSYANLLPSFKDFIGNRFPRVSFHKIQSFLLSKSKKPQSLLPNFLCKPWKMFFSLTRNPFFLVPF